MLELGILSRIDRLGIRFASALGEGTYSLCHLSVGLRAEFRSGVGIHVRLGRKGLVPGSAHFQRVSTNLAVHLFSAARTSRE